jgi:hypothetical protein
MMRATLTGCVVLSQEVVKTGFFPSKTDHQRTDQQAHAVGLCHDKPEQKPYLPRGMGVSSKSPADGLHWLLPDRIADTRLGTACCLSFWLHFGPRLCALTASAARGVSAWVRHRGASACSGSPPEPVPSSACPCPESHCVLRRACAWWRRLIPVVDGRYRSLRVETFTLGAAR